MGSANRFFKKKKKLLGTVRFLQSVSMLVLLDKLQPLNTRCLHTHTDTHTHTYTSDKAIWKNDLSRCHFREKSSTCFLKISRSLLRTALHHNSTSPLDANSARQQNHRSCCRTHSPLTFWSTKPKSSNFKTEKLVKVNGTQMKEKTGYVP